MTTDSKRKLADDKAYDSINDEDLDIEDAVARPPKVCLCVCVCSCAGVRVRVFVCGCSGAGGRGRVFG